MSGGGAQKIVVRLRQAVCVLATSGKRLNAGALGAGRVCPAVGCRRPLGVDERAWQPKFDAFALAAREHGAAVSEFGKSL